ncbi:MAG: OmpH family outer membrane protein [Bacteroidetes bacterium]|jgi:outer membrane protein|nr:OmpH family outer membrane protein [Bacteroidota bacterium]
MKRLAGIAVVLFLLGFIGQDINAQTLKFGHINSDELVQALPEYDSATVKIEKFRQDLINALELMQVEMNNKSEAYNKEAKNLTDIVRQTKEQELMDMNRRIQEFQTSAQQQLQEKQAELFQPIMAKIDKAIKDVGKENGFVYIYSVGQGSPLVYYDETKSTNIMPLAKAKLGIK